MPPDSHRWPQVRTLGQMFANHQLSWKLAPAQFAMAALGSFNTCSKLTLSLLGVPRCVKLGVAWRSSLDSKVLRLIFASLMTVTEERIQPLSKNLSQQWSSFQLKEIGVAFWSEVETPGDKIKTRKADLQITGWVRFVELPNRRWRIESNVKDPKLNGRNREESRQP